MKYLKTAFNLLLVVPVTLGLVLLVPFIILFRLINTKLVKGPGYTDIYAPYYANLNPYAGPEAWTTSKQGVPQVALDLYALHWVQAEVVAGGFSRFFDGATGIMAPEARDGFAAIGMDEVAALIQSAMDRLGTPFPLDREIRQNIVKIDSARMRFDETAKFKALIGNPHKIGGAPRYVEFADAYAAQHRQSETA